MTGNAANPAEAVAGAVAAGLADAVMSMTGARPSVTCHGAAQEPPESGVLWLRYDCGRTPGAALWLGAQEADTANLGRHILQALGVDDDAEEARKTYEEISGQGAAAAARSCSARAGAELDARPAGTQAPVSGSACYRIDLALSGAAGVSMFAAFSGELVGAAMPATAPDGGSPRTGREPNAAAASSKTFELLLDVEVPVRVSFGSAHIPIQEILRLTTGSIVELDRSISEPVEIIVNNRVIARGEVVVIEGNYGVRIDEIASRNERLRTTHEPSPAAGSAQKAPAAS